MVVVALIGVCLGIGPYVVRAPRHWRLSREMVARHAEREAACLNIVAEAEAFLRTDPEWSPFLYDIQRRPSVGRAMAAYHARMRRHWARVAYQPWRSIRAELEADVREQVPDAFWKTLGHGFPPELGAADY